MKKQTILWIMAIMAIIIGWSLFRHSQTQTASRTELAANVTVNTNLTVPSPDTNAAAAETPVAVSTNGSGTADTGPGYNQGQISKEQAIGETYLERNKQSQDFYGKIVDQYGQPVADVNVKANLILNTGTYGGIKSETYATQTDADGLFQFTGINGADLNVIPKKDGYNWGEHGEGLRLPAGSKTSPADRAVLTMWKIHGAELLTASSIDASIPSDGSSSTFDIATGKESPDGDLKITLSRSPLQLPPGLVHPYDWQVKIEIVQGGLIEEKDSYPYLAPSSGYQSSFSFEISSNSAPWENQLEDNFYIKNSRGQYGRMKFQVYSASTPAVVQINITINPSGSQNLEPLLEQPTP